MNINTNYDVVIVGAGPIGITTACTLKALHKDLKICVLDKNAESKRNHGLSVGYDSVGKIHEIINAALAAPDAMTNTANLTALKEIFKNWKNSFIRTSKIEQDLAKTAKEFGIEVLRDKAYEVSESNFDQLFDKEVEQPTQLQQIFSKAKVVIGADGTHSAVRKKAMGDKLTDQAVMQYLIELKYQTDGNMEPRSSKEASFEASVCGHVDFESMNKKPSEENKPVTLHIVTDKETYESLREVGKDGKLKGVFGNSWTLADLKEKGKTDEKIKKVYQQCQHHLQNIAERGGHCYDEKISTLELQVFRSEESVKEYKGKYVLLAGDANSAMVLERGFNKGLQEAALCAQAVADFFKEKPATKPDQVPHQFTSYQDKVRKIFISEIRWAKFKNALLSVAQAIMKYVVANFIKIATAPVRAFKHGMKPSKKPDMEPAEA